MSKFADRLKRLHDSRVRAGEAAAEAQEERAGVYLADDVQELPGDPRKPGTSTRHNSSRRGERDAWLAVGASNRNDHFWLDNRLTPDQQHGRYRLAEVPELDLPALSRELLGLFASSADISRAVFIDIETAGLGEGAGNEAWCIGLGRLVGHDFVVRHHILVHPDLEHSMLEAVADELEGAQVLVTFNGQTFDIPRIRGHFERHSIADPTRTADHIDLLKVVRRLVPDGAEASLQSAERTLLGFQRRHDVPGAESPRRWSRYLATLNVRPLLPLVEHNKLDIVSLAMLLVHCQHVLSGKRPVAPVVDRSRPLPTPPRTADSAKHGDVAGPEPSEFRKKLVRSYRLKNRSDDAGSHTRRRPRKPVPGSNVPTSFEPGEAPSPPDATVGERLSELRRTASRLLERGADAEAIPLLHEMLALSPRNPFPLAELARYYRDIGDAELANLFETRLRDVAPY